MAEQVTAAEAMQVVVEEGGPPAASMFAAIMDQQRRDYEATQPTWEMLWAGQDKSRSLGFTEGYATAREEIYERLFNGEAWRGES